MKQQCYFLHVAGHVVTHMEIGVLYKITMFFFYLGTRVSRTRACTTLVNCCCIQCCRRALWPPCAAFSFVDLSPCSPGFNTSLVNVQIPTRFPQLTVHSTYNTLYTVRFSNIYIYKSQPLANKLNQLELRTKFATRI